MPVTGGGLKASEVIEECRLIYLNDAQAQIYKDDVMLPYTRTAYQALEDRLVSAGISYIQEEKQDTVLNAGQTAFTTLPDDFLSPVWCGERTPGSTEEFKPMYQQRWPAQYDPDLYVTYWTWEEGSLKFRACTQNREIRVRYLKALAALSAVSSLIVVPNSKNFLAQKASALAAKYIGRNDILAQDLEAQAKESLDYLIGSNVKNMQGKGVRARPFRSFREKR